MRECARCSWLPAAPASRLCALCRAYFNLRLLVAALARR